MGGTNLARALHFRHHHRHAGTFITNGLGKLRRTLIIVHLNKTKGTVKHVGGTRNSVGMGTATVVGVRARSLHFGSAATVHSLHFTAFQQGLGGTPEYVGGSPRLRGCGRIGHPFDCVNDRLLPKGCIINSLGREMARDRNLRDTRQHFLCCFLVA